MKTAVLAAALMAAIVFSATADAQQRAPGQQAEGGKTNAGDLPEACRAAVVSTAPDIQSMRAQMQKQMQMQSMDGMMAKLGQTQRALNEAMMKMEPGMMQGMMAQDPDVAWACSMIPHHQGALDMSRAVLSGGQDPEIKKMAEKTIREQQKDIAELKEWVEKNATARAKK